MKLWILAAILAAIWLNFEHQIAALIEHIIGTAGYIGLDVYKKGKEYLDERTETGSLRDLQGKWSSEATAFARRAKDRGKSLWQRGLRYVRDVNRDR